VLSILAQIICFSKREGEMILSDGYFAKSAALSSLVLCNSLCPKQYG